VKIMRPALVGLTLLLGLNSTAGAAAPGLFNSVEFKAESLAALPQWQRVLKRIDDERPIYQRCIREASACPTRSVVAWQGMIRNQIGRSQLAQIDTVNRFLNDWRYRADSRNWGERDYWATPLEFLRFSGDCEDYAIAKYVTLRQLGFAAEQLRMVVVQDTVRDLAHAVLAVYLDGEVYILDNLSRTVLRQTEVSHYVPYYSINEDTRWAHVIPAGRKLTVASGRAAPGDG
jgi:predicted transglutaminase-like cysteine proteinase